MMKLLILPFVVLAILNNQIVSGRQCPGCGEILDEFDLKANELKSFLFNQTVMENCFRFSIKRLTDYELNHDISFSLAEVANKQENSLVITLMNQMANMKKLTETGHCFLAESRNKDILFNNDYTNFWLQSANGEISLRHEFSPTNFSEPFLKYNRDIGFKVNNFVVDGAYSSKGHWQIKLADCSNLPK